MDSREAAFVLAMTRMLSVIISGKICKARPQLARKRLLSKYRCGRAIVIHIARGGRDLA
ncbi:hypothetical protein I3J27_06705 [Bradyrhizobium xenonodulans]|uniref:Transposase n=1 Tax=Bradyrhizobium xenonodulans TaxID=2736875 RepID=A0ABY7MPL9_9BRAD|nr:hypothetical protein [Bradyrhizobium xenonodulans]WBL80114.1 hypothetical protein I3J27_06705 [Bradyrhizobium xenonodulans]